MAINLRIFYPVAWHFLIPYSREIVDYINYTVEPQITDTLINEHLQ
jgi:hypothetical protein